MNWQSGAEAPPALLVLPPAAVSLDEAHGAIEQWEFYSRKVLDPPQRLAVEIMLAESASGRWAARTTGREMPRQNGKGDELEVVEFWGLTQRGEAILHTAHELNTVSSAHQRMVGLLSHRDFKGKRSPKILNGLGQQSITMGDAVIQYRTRTAGGGRGLDDISRLIVDEAQHARPEQLASATPTLLANPNPQMNFSGTGGIGGVSDWWWSLRIRALGESPGEFGYLGHTAEKVHLDSDGRVVQEPVDPLDRSLWSAPNPALIYGRTEMEFLEEQLRLLGPALFAREHLGVWDPNPGSMSTFFPVAEWAMCTDVAHTPSGRLTYALDVDVNVKGEEWCSIACSDGVHIEVVTPPDVGPGTGWVLPAVAAKRGLVSVLVVDPSGPGGKLIAGIEATGVRVRKVAAQDVTQASMHLVSGVMAGQVRHIGQPVLTKAVSSVARRDAGDGSWRFSRKLSRDDISPLMAAALAFWGHQNNGPSVYEDRGMVSLGA